STEIAVLDTTRGDADGPTAVPPRQRKRAAFDAAALRRTVYVATSQKFEPPCPALSLLRFLFAPDCHTGRTSRSSTPCSRKYSKNSRTGIRVLVSPRLI